MADYVTNGAIDGFGHEFDALAPADSELLVTAASRLFDNLCEVAVDYFAPATSPATYTIKEFIGDGTSYLKLPPFTALNISAPVTLNDGTVLTPSFSVANIPDYVIRTNQLVVIERTRGVWPFLDGSRRYTGWPQGRQIKVSANWGWTATPPDVQMAVAHIAFHLWRTADPAFAQISAADGSASRAVTLPEIAQKIVDKYRDKHSEKFIFA